MKMDSDSNWKEGQGEVVEDIEIRPLPDATLAPVPQFNYDTLLPDELSWWIYDEASRSGAPVEYVAVAALVGLGSLVSPKVSFHPKMEDSWEVRPNLWGVVIGLPSSKKTPAISAGLRPLRRLDDEEQKRAAKAEKDSAKQKLLLKPRVAAAERAYNKAVEKQMGGSDAAHDAEVDRLGEAYVFEKFKMEQADKPARRFLVNDATIEKLGEILEHSPGVLQLRDEMTGWLNNLNREDRGNDRAFFLEAFNGGLEPYTYDRIGRGTVRIKQPIVSLLGGIQRDKIRPLVAGAASGSSDNDGLIQRFQLMVYPDYNWKADEDRMPHPGSFDNAMAVFRRLAVMPPQLAPMRLDEEAYPVFRDWRHGLARRIHEGADAMLPAMQSHLGKYEKLGISLAGLFAVIEGRQTISLENVRMAIAWCDFLEAHAARVYGLTDTSALEAAKMILARKDKLGPKFKKKDLTDKGWAGMGNKEVVDDALEMLVDYGHLRRVSPPPGKEGGRRGVDYVWTQREGETRVINT